MKNNKYILGLLTLFIAWLFFQSGIYLFKVISSSDNYSRYTIFNPGEGSAANIIIYDKNTGETWRYFRQTNEKGEPTEEGWVRVTYKDSVPVSSDKNLPVVGITPSDIPSLKDHPLVKELASIFSKKPPKQGYDEEEFQRLLAEK